MLGASDHHPLDDCLATEVDVRRGCRWVRFRHETAWSPVLESLELGGLIYAALLGIVAAYCRAYQTGKVQDLETNEGAHLGALFLRFETEWCLAAVEPAVEALDAPGGVDDSLLAREERVAGVANVEVHCGLGRTGHDFVPARTLNGRFFVIRV